MSPRDKLESKFSQDIEHLIEGREVLPGDSDYASMLEIARRLMTLKDEPEAEFASRLRQDLMLEMAQQDAFSAIQPSPSLFQRLFGGHGARLALVTTFVVLAAVGLVWRVGLPMMHSANAPTAMPATGEASLGQGADEGAKAAEAPAMAQASGGGAVAPSAVPPRPEGGQVTVEAHLAPSAPMGEPVNIALLFNNSGEESVTVSPFPPVVTITSLASGKPVYVFAAGPSSLELSPMQSTEYDLVWQQTDNAGNEVPAGMYGVDVGPADTTTTTDGNQPAVLQGDNVAVIEIVSG